jgi:hypothetical protein
MVWMQWSGSPAAFCLFMSVVFTITTAILNLAFGGPDDAIR